MPGMMQLRNLWNFYEARLFARNPINAIQNHRDSLESAGRQNKNRSNVKQQLVQWDVS